MKASIRIISISLCLICVNVFGQNAAAPKKSAAIFSEEAVKPRMRVIIDNDFGGDPDGLFQLVHHLLSPSVEIRAIIGSHLKAGDGFDRSNETAANAKKTTGVVDIDGRLFLGIKEDNSLTNCTEAR